MKVKRASVLCFLLLGFASCRPPAIQRDPNAPVVEWPTYGNDAGSSRYSPLAEITRANVKYLKVAWTYHTGDFAYAHRTTWHGQKVWAGTTFEATPLFVDGTLYVVSPFNRIIALDPETGHEKWAFDPKIDRIGYYGNYFTCRGLASWVDAQRQPGETCRRSIYVATLDGRLIAIDGASGQPCPQFGTNGEVSLAAGFNIPIKGEYYFTSAPAVVGDVVVVGSAINDSDRVEMESGVVRAYNTRSGAPVWAFDPVPRDPADPARATWQNGADRAGAGNVWGPISADPEHDLVFLPTTSPSPDFFGGERKGENRYADSVVALRASTGKLVWSFQAVHHDLWDYDLPSAPSLIEVVRNGQRLRALAQPSKMGYLFILDAETGRPIFPVEERPVPQNGVAGEWLSPTQPVPVVTRRLVPDRLEPQDAWGLLGRSQCRDIIAGLRRDGIFTPPSLQGTLQYPGSMGGTNWGGVAFDRGRGLIVLNQTNLPFIVQLIPREEAKRLNWDEGGWEYAPMKGTPYVMRRKPLMSTWHVPCNPPPWGTLAAVDTNTGQLRWQVPLGTVRELSPIPLPIHWGTPTVGGPISTAGGLTFIGATLDSTFRAFDTETGRELWEARVPASAVATPITYRARRGGRQYVVVSAGGHGKATGTKLGDSVVAFALP
jgi:quinoprotein glucose dehydrogenase